MTGFRPAAAALAVTVLLAAPALVGCTISSQGTAVAAGGAGAAEAAGYPDFGVLPTPASTPVPAGVTCAPRQRPRIGLVAKVGDPAAPVVTVAVPDGWSMQGGSGDVGARLQGPDEMSATVRIVASALGPQQAFAEYADARTKDSAVSALSVLPAELCDYSGQKLLGTLSDTPGESDEFVDRIVHIWTNSGDYLVAVQAQAPAGASGFDSAATQLTERFRGEDSVTVTELAAPGSAAGCVRTGGHDRERVGVDVHRVHRERGRPLLPAGRRPERQPGTQGGSHLCARSTVTVTAQPRGARSPGHRHHPYRVSLRRRPVIRRDRGGCGDEPQQFGAEQLVP